MKESSNIDRVELFVDLNCPFCFCQIDRVVSLGLINDVVWKGIEHEPDLPVPPNIDPSSSNDIAEEIEKLVLRESDFSVFDPGFRPNTGLANQWLCGVSRLCPNRLWEVVLAVGAALWREGQDISKLDTLYMIQRSRDLPSIMISMDDERKAQAFTREWELGSFDRRLPAARSRHGAYLLGLNSQQRFKLFVQSGKFSVLNGESC